MMVWTAGGLVVRKQRGPTTRVFTNLAGDTLLSQRSEPIALIAAGGSLWRNMDSRTGGLRVRKFNDIESESQLSRAVVSRKVCRR